MDKAVVERALRALAGIGAGRPMAPGKGHGEGRGDSDLRERMEASARQFEQPHARLFPLIGKRVWTPEGEGTLLSVFATRCEVLLDGTQKVIRVLPGEVCVIQ
jgi:hypothetical protein